MLLHPWPTTLSEVEREVGYNELYMHGLCTSDVFYLGHDPLTVSFGAASTSIGCSLPETCPVTNDTLPLPRWSDNQG